MKKLIFIMLAAAAMSCGDGTNRSSEREDDLDNGAERTETLEPDTATNGGIQSDTSSMYDRDRDAEINKNAKENDSRKNDNQGRSDTRKDSIK